MVMFAIAVFAYLPVTCALEANIPEETPAPSFPPLLQTTPAPKDESWDNLGDSEDLPAVDVFPEDCPLEDIPEENTEVMVTPTLPSPTPVVTVEPTPIPTVAPAEEVSPSVTPVVEENVPDNTPTEADVIPSENPTEGNSSDDSPAVEGVTPSADPVEEANTPADTPAVDVTNDITPIEEPVQSDTPTFVFFEEIPLSEDLQRVLWESCYENGIPYQIGLGLIETESTFRVYADNGIAYGLCQLNRACFPDGLSPADNIRTGMEHLGWHLSLYGNMDAALTGYYVGHDNGTRGYASVVYGHAADWANVIAGIPHP